MNRRIARLRSRRPGRLRPLSLERLESRWLLAVGEPNDTFGDANNLTTAFQAVAPGEALLIREAINTPTDTDFFRFTLGGPGWFYLDIDAINAVPPLSNVDTTLHLYDSSRTELRFVDDVAGSRDASMAYQIPSAGTYYVRVSSSAESSSGNYLLRVWATSTSSVLPDQYEPNQTLATATDLGNVSGSLVIPNLNIAPHIQGVDQDWFRFHISSPGESGDYVAIDFDNSLGDLNISLYDGAGGFLREATPFGSTSRNPNQEKISLSGRPAGTYYLHVYGLSNASNPRYSLSLETPDAIALDRFEANDTPLTATNLGTLSGTNRWDNLTVHTSQDIDWFRFELPRSGASGNHVAIDFDNSLGDLNIALYNAQVAFLEEATPFGYTSRTPNHEEISLAGRPAGIYYLGVFGLSNASNPLYSLSLSAPAAIALDRFEANDTRLTATNLGALAGAHRWDNLTIHTTQDADWFRFDLPRSGTSDNHVAIDFNNSLGDLNISLYDAQGTFLEEATPFGSSSRTPNHEEISLAGRPAGTYYLKVFGLSNSSNPLYALSLDAPAAISPDRFELNDTRATATDLGILEGSHRWDNLTIHTSEDADWFRFQLPRTGMSGNQVAIDFDNSLGDLNISLYDAQGTFLEEATPFGSSSRTPNHEEISLAGRPAGTYYLKVFGLSNSSNPLYALSLDAPAAISPDRFELNDTRATATDLGILEGSHRWDNLTIHTSEDADWFRFQLPRTGMSGNQVAIDFDNSLGDLNISLYDAQGTFLEEATPFGSSSRTPNHEKISLAGRPAGTYYFKVFALGNFSNPLYTLSLNAPAPIPVDSFEVNDTRATATDLGALAGTHRWDNLTVHTIEDADWFRFETPLTGFRGNLVAIDFDQRQGDLNVALYNSQGELLDEATPWGLASRITDREVISLAGRPAGVYYLQVFAVNRTAHPNYSLTVTAPGAILPDWAESNDTRASAKDFGALSGSHRWDALTIHAGDDVDWFRMEMLAPGVGGSHVSIEFTHREGDLDLELYDAQGTLVQSARSARDRELISLTSRDAGIYYLRIIGMQRAASSNYTLRAVLPGVISADMFESNDQRESATNLGVLLGANRWDQLSIHGRDDEDWYRFETVLPAAVTHAVSVTFDTRLGDLDITLFDSAGRYLYSSAGTSDRELIPLARFAPGVFFLRVFANRDGVQPDYSLKIVAPGQPIPPDSGESNELQEQALDLGRIVQRWAGDFSIHQPNDQDWYQLTLPRSGRIGDGVTMAFNHAECDLMLNLVTVDGQILTSSNGKSNSEQLDLSRITAGTYYLHVSGPGTCVLPTYYLAIDYDDKQVLPDSFEPNDQFDTATDLRVIDDHVDYPSLNIDSTTDRDYFRFETTSMGRAGDWVSIKFRHTLGDLDLRLFNDRRELVRESAGALDREEVSLEALPAGTYYILVEGYDSAVNPRYHLMIHASTATLVPDRFEPNESFQAAGRLRNQQEALSGEVIIDSLNLHMSQDIDYYRFTTVGAGLAQHRLSMISADHSAGLGLELFDSNLRLLASGREIPFAGLVAGDYYVRIATRDEVPVEYSLRLVMPESTPTLNPWTIMVYMTADNLQEAAFRDINEMERAAAVLPVGVNLAVYWDQSSAATGEGPDRRVKIYPTGAGSQPAWGTVGYGLVVPDQNDVQVATPFLIRPEENSGSAKSLSDFIAWTTTVAPAEQYALILWDHGAGVFGSNSDRSDQQYGDPLSISELVTALQDPRVPHLGLLAYDACYMGMLEVADAVAPYADYFVASQELVQGTGYDYTTLLEPFESGVAVSPEALAKGFVASFAASYVYPQNSFDTNSAIRSDRVGLLVDRLGQFVNVVSGASQTDWLSVLEAVRGTTQYYQFFDLGGMARSIMQNRYASESVRAAATRLFDALAESVLVKTLDQRLSSGLSIYFPGLAEVPSFNYLTEFSSFAQRTGLHQLVDALLNSIPPQNRSWGTRGLSSKDWAEYNDIPAFATRVDSDKTSAYHITDVNLHDANDVDWYRFKLPNDIQSLGAISLFSPMANQLTISLYHAVDLQLIRQETTLYDWITIPFESLSAGEYLLLVQGADVVVPIDYNFYLINFEVNIEERWEGKNSQIEKAYPLGAIGQMTLIDGLKLKAGDQDWFQLDTPRIEGGAFMPILIDAYGDVDVMIFDESGGMVSKATLGFDRSAFIGYHAKGAGERYWIQVVSKADSADTSYSISFQPNLDRLLGAGQVDERMAGAMLANLPVDDLVEELGGVRISDERVQLVGGQLRLADGQYFERGEAMQQWITLELEDRASGTWSELLIPVLIGFNPFPFQNRQDYLDVNADQLVTPLDALLIANTLIRNRFPGGILPAAIDATRPPELYWDVSGDAFLTPNDFLIVVNHLNQFAQNRAESDIGAGEGEGEREANRDSHSMILAPGSRILLQSTQDQQRIVEFDNLIRSSRRVIEHQAASLSIKTALLPEAVDAVWSTQSQADQAQDFDLGEPERSELERAELDLAWSDACLDWQDDEFFARLARHASR